MAVDQADKFIKKARRPAGKQSVDCILVNKDNADKVQNFSMSS
jgi:erythritol transport system substrate-binding protein